MGLLASLVFSMSNLHILLRNCQIFSQNRLQNPILKLKYLNFFDFNWCSDPYVIHIDFLALRLPMEGRKLVMFLLSELLNLILGVDNGM